MTALALLVVMVLGLLGAPCTSNAQQPTHVHRIGRLSGGSRSPDPNLEVSRQELRALGYVEGDNLVLELRYAEGQDERLHALAAELVRLSVEVLVAGGAPAARAGQQGATAGPLVLITP